MTQQLVQTSNRPTVSSVRSWSVNDCYYVIPFSMTWATNVLTFKARNHDLLTGDVVNIVSSVTASTYNKTAATVTVIDLDTFTIPYTTDPGVLSSNEIVNAQCQKYSQMMYRPTCIQVDLVPAGTTITIQQKIHPTATWLTLRTVANSDGALIIPFTTQINYVRAVLTGGTGQALLYSEGQ